MKWSAILTVGAAAILLFLSLRESLHLGVVGSRDVGAEGVSADEDFPVVVGVKGGMLEVAHVTGRKSIPRSTDPVILGQSISYCREKASWSVPYKITYRLKLEERWTIRYRKGTLYAKVPELEPAFPVAFDTRHTQKGATQSCWFLPDLGTRDRAFKAISPDLAKVATSVASKKFARETARQTVSEFLRNWAFNQKDYTEVTPDTPIRVIFPGE